MACDLAAIPEGEPLLRRPVLVLLWSALSFACAAPAAPEARHAQSQATLETPAEAPLLRALWREAKDTLDRRCVVCHGCYDAPCQLVLSSFAGVERGASKLEVYDGARLFAIAPTRLHIDADDRLAWRAKAFFPVLPEGPRTDAVASLFVRMLELKRRQPLPLGGALPKGFDLGLDRAQQCPRADEFDDFAKEHPGWGMPYALPALSDGEHDRLVSWVRQGTPHEEEPALAPNVEAAIGRWEAFFNRSGMKEELVARYIYEHLFLASLYFEGLDEQTFFRLVRSRTPPGEPIREIATRRPFEDPGTGPMFYRLARREQTVLAKTHMPYALSDARLTRYHALFFEPAYEVKRLPSYALETASNPFAAFAALPVRSRYRFMLEEAQFTLSGFIKGPVCRGQVALDVIQDRFWITFVDPESPVVEREAALLAKQTDNLRLPAEQGSNGLLLTWRRYARREKQYLQAKSEFLASLATSPRTVNLSQIWDGDGKNPNAALTVMRHFDSATVVAGLVGGAPKTAWVLSYGLLERIHYLLVAGFDVFGNIGHQLHTRMYMDFLRMEAEHNFLLLLPRARRRPLVEAWYRDAGREVKERVYGDVARFEQESGIAYTTAQPERELYRMLEQRLAPVLGRRYDLAHERDAKLREPLARLTELVGTAASYVPETTFLEVRRGRGAPAYFTLLRESAHTNVAQLFREEARRKPDEDRVTPLRGFVGVYPNALFTVTDDELPALVSALSQLESEQMYEQLRARYGVRRTDPHFWAFSDRIHDAFVRLDPREGGLFDFNRLDAF